MELLVVIAIITILIALLLPAVQAARAAAIRASCQNNLRQLALGSHNFHNDRGYFPPGWIAPTSGTLAGHSTNPSLDTTQWSGLIALLPYMDKATAYNGFNFTTPTTANASTATTTTDVNYTVCNQSISQFICPADPTHFPGQFDKNNNLIIGRTNYRGSSGYWPGSGPPGNYNSNGVVFMDSKTSIPSIVDGTSTTILLGETLDQDPNVSGTYDKWFTAQAGALQTFNQVYATPALLYNNASTGMGSNTGAYWGSYHSNSFNVAFADGSVRPIPLTLTPSFFGSIVTRATKEDVPAYGEWPVQ